MDCYYDRTLKLGAFIVRSRMFSDQIPAGEDDLMKALARREPKVVHSPTYVEELDKAFASMERLMKKYHGGSDGDFRGEVRHTHEHQKCTT